MKLKVEKLSLQIILSTISALAVVPLLAQTFDKGMQMSEPGFGYNDILAFDADLDSDLDILSFPYLYLNDGTGKRHSSRSITHGKTEYIDIATADIDNDKDQDIVVLYKNGTFEIFENIKGKFKKIDQENNLAGIASNYAKLSLYDLNADGICDITVETLEGPRTRAYIGNKNNQFTYFKAFNKIFRNTSGVIATDTNNDSYNELLCSTYNKAEGKIYLKTYSYQNGDYIIQDSIQIPDHIDNNYIFADMDNDEDDDLVYSIGYFNVDFYWLERGENGSFVKAHPITKGLRTKGIKDVYDFDQDGDLDISYFVDSHSQGTDQPYNWLENVGDNNYVKATSKIFPQLEEVDDYHLLGDFNGDGIEDITFYNGADSKRPRYNLITRTEKGYVKENNRWIIAAMCEGFDISDLNNDSLLDITGYYRNEIFYTLCDSSGKWSSVDQIAIAPFKIGGLKTGDLNNDGLKDIIISTGDLSGGKIGWFKNLGNIEFGSYEEIHSKVGRVLNFEAMDVNGNSNLDLVVNYWLKGKYGFYYYHNSGNGIFKKEFEPIIVMDNATRFHAVDIDADGIEDIVNYGRESKTWCKIPFSDKPVIDSLHFEGRFIKGIFSANVDNDDNADFLIPAFQSLKWFELENKIWKDSVIFGKSHDIDKMRVGDLNGDGLDDIICIYKNHVFSDEPYAEDITFQYKYSIIMLSNQEEGNFKFETLFPINEINQIELLDFDLDGDLDIVSSSSRRITGGITMWRNLIVTD